jgi:glycosyltransferase involved in cell wall biosynthesis
MIIGIANNLYPPYGRGSGAEVIVIKTVQELRAAGHEVFVISTKPLKSKQEDSSDCYYFTSAYHSLASWSPFKKMAWHCQQLLFSGNRRRLNKILKERRPDLFVTHNLIGLGFSLPSLLFKLHIRHEHILHDIQLLHPSGLMYFGQEKIICSPLARFYQFFTRRAFKKADLIISPSRWLLNTHQERGFFKKQESRIQKNFQLDKPIKKEPKQPLNFLFTGQLEKHKGIDMLLRAWQEASLPEAKLSIAGGGSLAKMVAEQAEKQTNIHYLGYLDREGIDQALQKADIIIVPSLVYENSPTSLWEAAARGLCAIASDIGGIPEMKDELHLTLFPPGNLQALIAAIKEAADKKNK